MSPFAPPIARRVARLAAGVAFLASVVAVAQEAEEEAPLLVRAEGRAAGTGLTARAAAVEAACRSALEEVLGSLVAGATLDPFKPMLESANRYVPRYDLLRSDVLDAMTRVEIDAEIAEKPLYTDTAALALPLLPAPPTVLLVIGEQVGSDRILAVPDFGTAENTLAERIKPLGVQVSRATSLDGLFTMADLIAVLEGGREAGSAFAQKQLEDVVVIGRASTTHEGRAGGRTNVLRNRAAVTLHVYRSSDGKLIDVFQQSAAVYGLDANDGGFQAVEDACAKLVGDVAVSATLAVLKRGPDPAVRLTLRDAGAPAPVEAAAAHLAAFPGVHGLVKLMYTPAVSRFRFLYDGPMVALADSFLGVDFAGRALDVTRAVGRDVEATFE